MQKIETVHDIWQSRKLTLFGRCLITKGLALSQLIHPFSILDIPKNYIKAADSVIFQFIWRKKKDKIKRKVMFLDFDQGGLRAPSVETMSKSLKLAWISRFLINDEMSESWRAIPNHYFDKYGGLKFLLRCNYDQKFLEQVKFPNFYKLLLYYFSELKSSYNPQCTDQELILFNNKEIRINGQTIFYESWFNRNVILIQDLLKTDGKFFSHAEFVRKYEFKCNFLTYMQIVSAIPQSLIDKARKKLLDKSTLFSVNEFQLSTDITINLLKMKNKDYYWLLIKNTKDKHILKGSEKWKRDLQSDATVIDSFFRRVRCISRDNKLREFYFKLLHRIVVTRRELHFFGLEKDPLCIYCQENDSIFHTFCNCHWSKEFYSEVIKWFNKENAN